MPKTSRSKRPDRRTRPRPPARRRPTGPTTRSSSAAATTAWSTAPTWRRPGLRTLDPRAPPPRRRRGDHRGAPAGLLVHDVLVRAEPAPAGHHPGARAGQARLHAAPDAVDVRPDGERRLPAARPGPRREPQARSRATRSTTPTPTTRSTTTCNKVCQAIKPLLDEVPPDIFSDDPEELIALAALGSRFRRLDKKVLHDAVRLLTGSAPTSSTTTSSRTSSRATSPRRRSSARRSGRTRRARGSCCCTTRSASTTASSGRGRSTRAATAASPRSSPGRRSRSGPRSALESPVDRGHHEGRPGDRRRPRGRHRVPRPGRRLARSTRGGRSSSSSSRASCPTDLVETIQRFRFQGTSAKVNFALDGAAALPGARRPRATSTAASPTSGRRWSTSSGPSTTRSTAGTRSGRTSTARSSRRSTRTWRRPASTSCSASSSTRRTSCARATGTPRRQNLGDTVQATLESFFPGFGDLVLQREVRTPLDIERTVGLSRGQHLRRRVPRAADVLLPAGARAGRSTGRRSTATTSAARAPTRAAASWARRASSPPARSSRTASGPPGVRRRARAGSGPAPRFRCPGRRLRPCVVQSGRASRADRHGRSRIVRAATAGSKRVTDDRGSSMTGSVRSSTMPLRA